MLILILFFMFIPFSSFHSIYCKCNVVFDIKIYTTLRGLLTNKQSTEKESRTQTR